jgi:serine/threonine-protein kinase HipA
MTQRCLSCLGAVDPPAPRHPACVRALFGSTREPSVDLAVPKIRAAGHALAGRTAFSGAKRKVALGLSADRATLRVAPDGAQFILKPQAAKFPALPENEHTTMLLAKAAGIETPRFGLVRVADDSLAFIMARFDRVQKQGGRDARTPRNVAMEDFSELAAKPPKEKADGSAEHLFRLVRRYASEPQVDAARLFRQLVFAWWTGNGDLHMKNLALVADGALHRLSPAFDLLSTRLVIADDPLAVPVGGKRDGITRDDWLALATYARIAPRAAAQVLDDIAGGLDRAVTTVDASFLGDEMRASYATLLRERAAVLAE